MSGAGQVEDRKTDPSVDINLRVNGQIGFHLSISFSPAAETPQERMPSSRQEEAKEAVSLKVKNVGETPREIESGGRQEEGKRTDSSVVNLKGTGLEERSGARQEEEEKKIDPSSVINLKVKDLGGSELVFRVKRYTRLRMLMNTYCDRQSKNPDEVCFLFQGRRVHGDRTPEELEMNDGDEIDVMPIQGRPPKQ